MSENADSNLQPSLSRLQFQFPHSNSYNTPLACIQVNVYKKDLKGLWANQSQCLTYALSEI